MMELSEDFLKLLQIAIIVVGVLAIFFTYIQYNILVIEDKAGREAIVLGNYLLKSNCIAYENTKGLFSEEKLNNLDVACLDYDRGFITINLLDETRAWTFKISDPTLGGVADFYVSVKMGEEVKPAKMVVEL